MSQWASRVRCWSVNMKTTSCCNTVNFREQCRMIPNYSYLCPITHKNCHMATEPHKTGNALRTLDLSFGIDNSTDASGSMHTDYSFKFAKRFWNNRLKIIVGGKVSSGADVPNQNESFFDNVTFEYRLGDTSNKYLRLFYDNNSYDWLEGTTQEFGVGFTWRKTMQHFKDLFRKERKMQMPAAPQRPAPGDSTKTPLVNREIK